ncbi:MAG TPA: hypothetical protein VJA46_00305 [Acidimicrobiia bacterium]|nr:hypothetical protein [Acidimicrobiia bacterium]
MIRLGSLAGYPFEGPRLLAGWTAPALSAVFAITYKPDPVGKPEEYGVLYVGHSEDLSKAGFPFSHPVAPCWLKRVEQKRFALYICTYEAPGATAAHREQITRELIAMYRPGCNPDQYDQAWKDQWIGEYQTPGTTGPLTTNRDPSAGNQG